MRRLRTVVADDNVLVREGLRALLDTEARFDVLAVCGDRDELLAAAERHRPDLVVTDIRMPPTHTDEGLQVARRLQDTQPEAAVLVLSQFVESSYALALLERGSKRRGYLLKERVTRADQLLEAIRAVTAGGSYIDDAVIDALVAARARGRRSPLDRLSEREADILAEVAKGRSNAAIGADLQISVRAVEKHVSSIFTKLDLVDDPESHRRVRAALMALGHAV